MLDWGESSASLPSKTAPPATGLQLCLSGTFWKVSLLPLRNCACYITLRQQEAVSALWISERLRSRRTGNAQGTPN